MWVLRIESRSSKEQPILNIERAISTAPALSLTDTTAVVMQSLDKWLLLTALGQPDQQLLVIMRN